MYSMLFGNNSGGGANALLDGAPFYLELTHTAVPTRGNITPSFTRATTETGQKWDEAGYLDFTALAGEMVFKGARRERNHFAATEALDGASWAKSGATVTASAELDPEGETRAFRVQLAGGGLTYVIQAVAFPIGSVTLPAFYVKSNTAGDQTFRIIADGGVVNSADFTATQEWQAFKLPVSATTQANDGYGIREGSGLAAADILVALPRCSDVTGETDQTTIRPYVSVGVESAPAYHGSMVDGVKCYDTDRSGNPISTSGSYPLVGYVPWEARTNSLLHSRDLSNAAWVKVNCTGVKDAVGSDGVPNSASTLTATGANATCLQTLVLAAAARSYSVKIKRKTGTGTVSICRDGVTFTDITAEINSSTYTTVKIENTSVLNPVCGIKLATSGDAVYVDWNQDEAGAFSTPSIGTTTIAVARNSDVLTYTGADVANIKTLACTFSRGVGVSSVGVAAVLTDGTNAEAINLYLNDATSMRCNGTDNNVTQWAVIASNAYTPGTDAKVSVSFVANDVKTDFNGTAGTQDTSATLPTFTQLQIGFQNTAFTFNGPVNHIYGWTRNLSQSELGAVDRA